jgi:uncharacterized protein YbjQ (UPF0145 family)
MDVTGILIAQKEIEKCRLALDNSRQVTAEQLQTAAQLLTAEAILEVALQLALQKETK